MTTHLDSLKKYSLVVADTGDIDAVARWKPQDATTNPSLLLTSAEDPRYQPLVESAIRDANGDVGAAVDALFVQFGVRILKHVAGRVSTEVDARLSFDTEKSIDKAHRLIALYEKEGVSRSRVLIKLASTWEGIRAAEKLEKEKIHCNMCDLDPARLRKAAPGNNAKDTYYYDAVTVDPRYEELGPTEESTTTS